MRAFVRCDFAKSQQATAILSPLNWRQQRPCAASPRGSSGRTRSLWLRRAVIAVTVGLFVAATITPITTIFMPAVNGWLDISPAMAWPEIAAIDCAA
jgi:hypothetical protein